MSGRQNNTIGYVAATLLTVMAMGSTLPAMKRTFMATHHMTPNALQRLRQRFGG